MNKEIEEKLEEITSYIKKTDSYQNYLKAKEIMDNRKDIKEKIEEIKKYQKEIINNPNKKHELENKINYNLKYLESDITYLSYQESLDEVNNMLNILENKLNNYFDEVFH